MLVTHAKASGLIALHRVHSKLLYSLGALLFAVCRFVDIYTRRGEALWHCVQGKCTGHSVTFWKAKRKGTLIGQCLLDYDSCMYCIIFFMYVLRHTHEECLAVPLASEHPLHFIKYTLTYCILFGALLFVVCIHVDIYTRGREALWHCLQGKCTRALCHSLEGKGEGHSDWSMHHR